MSVEEALTLLQNEPTRENAINYIVTFTENFVGRQGYYDYFLLSTEVYKTRTVEKLHYRGKYKNFVYLGENEAGELCFSARATVFINLEYFILDRQEEVLNAVFEQVKKKAYKDVIVTQLVKPLRATVKKYYGLEQFNLNVAADWRLFVQKH